MRTFRYERADSFQQAGELKAKLHDAEFVAGGTDLLGVLKREILPAAPDALIDLKRVSGSKGIEIRDGKMRIGALTTLTSIVDSEDVKREFPMLAEAAHSVATPLVRNTATLGGNLCQDVRCWFYRYPHEASGRLNCARKCGEECYAIHGENRYHSIFGGYKICTSQCTRNCPAGTDISTYMGLIREGKWDEAAETVLKVNPMPMITSRICPHPCQDECNQGKHGDCVNIHCVERTLGDYILQHADKFYRKPEKETGKKVAVIGAGPSGLAAAYYLRNLGHDVTVIDKMEKAGGVLMYGIPHYRLPKDIMEAFTAALEGMGVKFRMNTAVGKDIDIKDITEEYDNVFIGTGAWKQPILGIHGEELTHFGLNFLVEVNTYLKKVAQFGENVLVCGGGNVAMDVALTAVRLGAKKVTLCCLEQEHEMPAAREEIERAKEEGVTIINGRGLSAILEENGKVKGLETKKCVSVFNEQHRFSPVYDEDDKSVIEADTIILATGQRVDLDFLGDKFGAQLKSERGLLEADGETFKTAMPHVYGAGDAVTGPNIAIRAIAGGVAAAKSITAELGYPIEKAKAPARELHFDAVGVENRVSHKAKELPVRQRALDVEDSETLSLEEAQAEARRCMDCGCYAVSPSDTAPVLIALGAEIVTTKRTLSAAEFFCTSPKVKDVLEADEIVTRIDIPLTSNLKGQYLKFRLRDAVDFAIVGVASAFHVQDGKITGGKLVFGGVSPMPRVADDVIAFLADKPITDELAEQAAELAVKDAVALRCNAHKIVILKSMVKESILAVNA